MHDSSLIWRKHGDIFAHECIPLWRFEGRGMMQCIMPFNSFWATTKNRAFMAIESEPSIRNVFMNWDEVSSRQDGHSKCLSGGTLRRIQVLITQNSMPHNLNFALFKDEFRELAQYFTLEASSGLHVEEINLFEPLVFDHRYGYGWTTDDGTIPDFENSAQTIQGWITTDIAFGGGDG